MEDNRQISHAEKFQVIYVAVAPSREGCRSNSFPLLCGLHRVTSIQGVPWRTEKYYLGRVVKANLEVMSE